MSCCSCHLDLRSTTFIKCAECNTPSVELCILCFTGNYETEQHRANHAYNVLTGDHLHQTALHEASLGNLLLLLDCSRKFSVGSWADVQARSKLANVQVTEQAFMSLYQEWSATCGHNYPPQDFEIDSSCLGACTLAEGEGMLVQSVPIPSGPSDIPGFMPNRVDFEHEYDDSAELILADLEINDDDTSAERELKLECLRGFTQRVKRRELIKTFVVKEGLTSVQNQIDRHRCRTSEEVEIRGKLRPVERFFKSVTEFESLVQLVLYEKRIAARVRRLREKLGSPPVADSIKIETPESKELILPMEDVKENKDPSTSKPVTRSRAASEIKKGRTAEDECLRINDTINEENVNAALIAGLDEKEMDLIGQLGLNPGTFSILRDVILKRCCESGSNSASITVSKFGEAYRVQVGASSGA